MASGIKVRSDKIVHIFNDQINLCDSPTKSMWIYCNAAEYSEKFKEECQWVDEDYDNPIFLSELLLICSVISTFDLDSIVEIGSETFNGGYSAKVIGDFIEGNELKTDVVSLKNIEDWGNFCKFCTTVDPAKNAGYHGVFVEDGLGQDLFDFTDHFFENDNIPFAAFHNVGVERNDLPERYEDMAIFSKDKPNPKNFSVLDEELYNRCKEEGVNKPNGFVETYNNTGGGGLGVLILMNKNYRRNNK